MFGWKRKALAAEQRAEKAELQLMLDSMRLAQYDSLMAKLRKYDNFRFNSGGGIIAYNKGEPEMYGTAYSWPDPRFRCQITYN